MNVDAGQEDAALDDVAGRRIIRAVKDWTGQLIDVSGRNTLLSFKDLKAGTLDLSSAKDVALERMLAGFTIRFSEAFADEELSGAARRGRAIQSRSE